MIFPSRLTDGYRAFTATRLPLEAKPLRQACRIRAQIVPPTEIIVVEDESTDDT